MIYPISHVSAKHTNENERQKSLERHCTPLKPITNTAWVSARLCKLQKRCIWLAAASDKVYQLLAHGRWFSPGTPASSTTKTGRHYIAEIFAESGVKTPNNQIKLIPLILFFQIGVYVGHTDICMEVFSYILPTAHACRTIHLFRYTICTATVCMLSYLWGEKGKL